MADKKTSYQALKDELDTVLDDLQSNDGDIDKAVELHKRGNILIRDLEKYLTQAKNSLKKAKK